MPETQERQDKLREVNEALVLAGLRQQELIDEAELLNRELRVEIKERMRVEAALRESEAYSTSLFEANPDCVKILTFDGRIERINSSGQCIMEIEHLSSVYGVYWPSLWPEAARAKIEAALASARTGGTGRFSGFCSTRKGTPRWWDVMITAVPSVSSSPMRLIATSRDITERNKIEQRQLLLTRELAHRGSNLMAVIQAIVSRSLTGPLTLSQARDVLISRVHALARSQAVLLNEGYVGAFLSEIVRLELEAYPDQVKVAGPPVMMNPKIAQTFSLLVHELATNAFKHGALRGPGGKIAIAWSSEGEGMDAKFRFTWRESGGPPVAAPTRKGFGRTLLENVVEQEFGIPPNVIYHPDGLVYEIEAPLEAVIAGNIPE